MAHEKIVRSEVSHNHAYDCISWSAIIIGALVALGFEFLLNLFGLGIGLGAYATKAGTTTLVMGGFIASIIGVMVPLFFAGWVAGYIGRLSCTNENLGLLYGFATWALALILSILLAAAAARFVAVQYQALTNPSSVVTSVTQNTSAYEAQPARSFDGASQKATLNEEEAKTAAKSLLMLFVLFFVGAISASYGGYVGMRTRTYRTSRSRYVK